MNFYGMTDLVYNSNGYGCHDQIQDAHLLWLERAVRDGTYSGQSYTNYQEDRMLAMAELLSEITTEKV